MTIKIEAGTRLQAGEKELALLDPISDSLNHALKQAQAAKAHLPNNAKDVMALVQSIKDALTELQMLQEAIGEGDD